MEHYDDIPTLKKILAKEPFGNLFFINDLELHGQPGIEVWHVGGLYALDYRSEGLCLYADGQYDMDEALSMLSSIKWATVMGPADTMAPFISHFPGQQVLEREMMALEAPAAKLRMDSSMDTRILSDKDALHEMFQLYNEVPTFAAKDSDRSEERAAEEAGRTDCLYASTYVDGKLVSCAGLSAIANKSAMVIGVCTHPGYQKRGLATQTLSFLLDKAYNDLGLAFTCLWYTDEIAGSLYRKLGYHPTVRFTSISKLK